MILMKDQNNILICGICGSGKTVYITVLFELINNSHLSPNLYAEPNHSSLQYLAFNRDCLFRNNTLPPPTQTRRFEELSIILRDIKTDEEVFGISTVDLSGDDLVYLFEPSHIVERFKKIKSPELEDLYNRLMSKMNKIRALIFLLDPLTRIKSVSQYNNQMQIQNILLRNILYILLKNQKEKKNDITVFLCISKFDTVSFQVQDVENYIADKYPLPCILAKQITDDIVYCGISSLGKQKSNYYLEEITPFNVLLPIRHLLKRDGINFEGV